MNRSRLALACVLCAGAAFATYETAESSQNAAPDPIPAKAVSSQTIADGNTPTHLEGPALVELNSLRGESVATEVSVTYRGRPLQALRISADPGVTALPASFSSQRRAFVFRVKSTSGMSVGDHQGWLRVSGCIDAACDSPERHATLLIPYVVHVKTDGSSWEGLDGWSTQQGNLAHNGYVPIRLRPESFAFRWSWRIPTPTSYRAIHSVVTESGRVFVSDASYRPYAGVTGVYALSESDGSVQWYAPIPATSISTNSPPSVSNGRVYVSTSEYAENGIYGLDVATGRTDFSGKWFDGSWDPPYAPTVYAGRVMAGEPWLHAFDLLSGARLWTALDSGSYGSSEPAVEGSSVYIYGCQYGSTCALSVYDVSTGANLKRIPDNDSGSNGWTYGAAVMISSPDNIITFSGATHVGQPEWDALGPRALVNFSPSEGRVRWRTVDSYITQPAAADGVIYAGTRGSINRARLDAIDEATGRVLWSFSPLDLYPDFVRNVVVTMNLVFVSTNYRIYAIDLKTHQPVWSYPITGGLSISADGTLFVEEREYGYYPTGVLTAISLR